METAELEAERTHPRWCPRCLGRTEARQEGASVVRACLDDRCGLVFRVTVSAARGVSRQSKAEARAAFLLSVGIEPDAPVPATILDELGKALG